MSDGPGPAPPDRATSWRPSWRRAWLRRRLGIDRRALAAFRISVGLVLLADLAYRTRSLQAFYTDAGVLPREANRALYPTLSAFSVHGLSGAAWLQWLLFGVAAAFAALLVVGYRTRVSAVGSWLLLASLQFRNYLVLNGGDTVLLVALFIALFLPLGDRWSLDALAGRRPGPDHGADAPPSMTVGFGTAALLTQVILIYATNAVYKLRSDAWTSGAAIPTVYRIDRFTVLLGDHLAAYTDLLTALTYGWLGLLVASPLLLVTTGWRRTTLVAAYASAHVGMYLTLDLGFFPHAMLACLLLFVPPTVWDSLETRVQPLEARIRLGLNTPRYTLASEPLLPTTVRAGARRLLPVATATILVVGFLWQGVALGYVAAPADAPVDPADHSWKLFAPNPPASDGWFRITGTLETGDTVDLYPHAATLDGPPSDTAATYPSTRWRKYLAEVRADPTARRYFAAYLCRWGADRYGTAVESLSITYVRVPVGPGKSADRQHVDLGRYRCPVTG